MSRPPAKKQGLSLNDVSQQVISLAASSKDGLGPLLSGTLYEALSSTLVDIEEQPTGSGTTIEVILSHNTDSGAPRPTVVDVSSTFLCAVASGGPSWPTTLLLSRLLSYVAVDARNINVWSSCVKGLLKVLATKDLAASRIAVLECLSTLFNTKSILLSDVLRTNELYDQLFRQIKFHGNSVPLAQARVSLFRCLEALVKGVGFGQALPKVHEMIIKIIKYWVSCSEKSLLVKSAAARFFSVWAPFAASSYAAITSLQSTILAQLNSSPCFGHAYGCLLYTALQESYSKVAVQPALNLPPSKPGAPPHDSAGVLGYKEYASFEAILEHVNTLWAKNAQKRDFRESVAACLVSFYSQISFQFLEKKLSIILNQLLNWVSNTQLKATNPTDSDEIRSSVSYILHSGIISNCTEDGKRLVFKELLSVLEALATITDPATGDSSKSCFILAEIYSLFSELGESVVPIVSNSGSGLTIEDVLLPTTKNSGEGLSRFFPLLTRQQMTISSAAHKKAYLIGTSPTADGNSCWLWIGLVLKRYCAVNDQFFIGVQRLREMLPSPIGQAGPTMDPLPAVWAYASTKRTRPASSAEFSAMLSIAQSLITGPTAQPASGANETANAASWSVAGWILLSSLLLRGSDQSAEQDRASMVSSHLATLQLLWKTELSKRPASDVDINDFAMTKLWLLYSLKHFLANFSRLAHESNMTTFITQCLNTVLKSVTTWQATNSSPKAERDCNAIDALIIALLQSYTTLATHIFNPPSTMSPRQQLTGSTEGSSTASFPARSVLQMIAKQMVRPRYVVNQWMARTYLHLDDDALELNVTPSAGTLPASSTLYTDLHSCTATISNASMLLWSEWSCSLLQTRKPTANQQDTNQLNLAAQLQAQQVDTVSAYVAPAAYLLSEMASLFPPLFHQQQESHQLQLLQYLGSCLASNTSHTSPVHSNVLYFLLAIAKENAKLSGAHQLGTLLASSPSAAHNKPLSKALLAQVVALVEPYVASPQPTLRRLAAETYSHAVDADESLLGPTIKHMHQALWKACGYNSSTPSSQIPPPTNSLAQLIKSDNHVQGCMLALGSIHRVVGGIRSRQFMNETIKVLTAINRITFETRPPATSSSPASTQHVNLNRTALHSLWIALEATGLTDTSFASSTLSAMLDGIISDVSREWQTFSHLGRIIGSIAAILGPELQASIALLRRLQGAIILLDCVGSIEVEDIGVSFNATSPNGLGTDWVPPRSLAPVCLAYTASTVIRERLLLFAPQFSDAHKSSAKLLQYVRSMRRNTDFDDGSRDAALWSPVSFMRLNALRVLRFLAQLNPHAFQNDEIVRQVVLCPDRETLDSSVQGEMRILIATLEETLVPLNPLKWLEYASHFVMGADSSIKLELSPGSTSLLPSTTQASSTSSSQAKTNPAESTKAAAGKPSVSQSKFGGDDEDPEGEPLDETEEEMAGINTLSAPVVERVSAVGDDELRALTSSVTALFISSIHYVFEPLKSQKVHFDTALAAQKRLEAERKGAPKPYYLVDFLSGIVALASKASSASVANVQISGLEAVHDILERFSETADLQLEGHFLLELYVAQMSAALRRCIARDSPVANRVCHVSYVVLAEMILWIAKHVSDVAALRQLLRPFLDPQLEKQPLHTEKTANASQTTSNESDSPISLELNPRYVAWLMASALLWQESDALKPKVPDTSETNQKKVSAGLSYLQESFNDPVLRQSLCGGWLSILEYRAVQQYSQDLTQLTLFGSASNSSLKNNILGHTESLGINWCHVLIAMCSQFADHVWSSLKSSTSETSSQIRSELSRSAHILFGLILHNLANGNHVSLTLKALKALMNGLSQLDEKAVSPTSLNLLPLPALAISELCQALANLFGVINYRDYHQKAQLLAAIGATVEYTGLHNRILPTDSANSSPPSITESFFHQEMGAASNRMLLKDVIFESLEHGGNMAPSTRHNVDYLSAVLRTLASTWKILSPSQSQLGAIIIWLGKVVRLSTPDLPCESVQQVLVPLILQVWESIAASSPEAISFQIKYAVSQVSNLQQLREWSTEDSYEGKFLTSALLKCVSALPKETESYTDLASVVINELAQGALASQGNGLTALRAFIQKETMGGNIELSGSTLAVLVPVLYERFSSDSHFNIASLGRSDLEQIQEVLKITALLMNVAGVKESTDTLRLIITALIHLLSPSTLPFGSLYTPIHDSSVTVLLHLGQTNPEQFKLAFSNLDTSERTRFETAVRAHIEKQQAQQAAQNAGKVKFSLDTSQYAK